MPGEWLSSLFMSMFLNDFVEQFESSGLEGIDANNMFKICMPLYADDIVLFTDSAEYLQEG